MFRLLTTVMCVGTTMAFGNPDPLHNSPSLTIEFSSGKEGVDGLQAIEYLKRFGVMWTPYYVDPSLNDVLDKLASQTATPAERAVLDPLVINTINPGRGGFEKMLASMGRGFGVPGGGDLETLDTGGNRSYPRIYGADIPSPAQQQAQDAHVKKFSKLTDCIGEAPEQYSVDQFNFFLRGPESEWFFAIPDGDGEVIKVVSGAIEKGMMGWVAVFSAGDAPHGAFATGNPGVTVAFAIGPKRWAVSSLWEDVPLGNPSWVMYPWAMGNNPWVDYQPDPPVIASTPLFDPIPEKAEWLRLDYSSGKPSASNYDAVNYLAKYGILWQPHPIDPTLLPLVDALYANTLTPEDTVTKSEELIKAVFPGREGFEKTLTQVGREFSVVGGGDMTTSESGRVYPRVYVTPQGTTEGSDPQRNEHILQFSNVHVNIGVETEDPATSYAGVPEWDFFMRGRETDWFFAFDDGEGEVVHLWFKPVERGEHGYMIAFPAGRTPHGAYPMLGIGGVTVAFSVGPKEWDVNENTAHLPPKGAAQNPRSTANLDQAWNMAWALDAPNPWVNFNSTNPTLLTKPYYSPTKDGK